MNRWTLSLIASAAFMNGLLTGGNVDRLLVATPAWKEVGLNGWADFSRVADLGHGQIVYPVLALGSTAMAIMAAVSMSGKRHSAQGSFLPVALSAALMLMALPFSLKAVPFMQSLRCSRRSSEPIIGGISRAIFTSPRSVPNSGLSPLCHEWRGVRLFADRTEA